MLDRLFDFLLKRLNLNHDSLIIEQLLEQGHQFDVVCSMEVIEHVDNPAGFLKVLGQLVKVSPIIEDNTNTTDTGMVLILIRLLSVLAQWRLDFVNYFSHPSRLFLDHLQRRASSPDGTRWHSSLVKIHYSRRS